MTSRNLFGNQVIDVEEDAAIADRLQQEEYHETDDPLSQGQPPFESTDATAQPAIASTDAPVHMPPTTILSRSKKAPPATATTTTMPYALVRRLFRECSTTFAHSTCSAPIRLVRYINLLHGRVHCALLSSGVRQAATTCTASGTGSRAASGASSRAAIKSLRIKCKRRIAFPISPCSDKVKSRRGRGKATVPRSAMHPTPSLLFAGGK